MNIAEWCVIISCGVAIVLSAYSVSVVSYTIHTTVIIPSPETITNTTVVERSLPVPFLTVPPIHEARNTSVMAQTIFDTINEYRTTEGLNRLERDDTLDIIAAGHSQDMIDREYYSHTNPDGEGPTDRAISAGYTCTRYTNANFASSTLGENIIVMVNRNNTISTAGNMVEAWLDSPGHHDNIVYPHFTKSGVGVAFGLDSVAYVTQLFC